jgi:hypothetical protein
MSRNIENEEMISKILLWITILICIPCIIYLLAGVEGLKIAGTIALIIFFIIGRFLIH